VQRFQRRVFGLARSIGAEDRAGMTAGIRRHMAHRLVARERQAASIPQLAPVSGYSSGALWLARTSGFAFGALILLILAIYLGFIAV